MYYTLFMDEEYQILGRKYLKRNEFELEKNKKKNKKDSKINKISQM